jgi:hypothetical protein
MEACFILGQIRRVCAMFRKWYLPFRTIGRFAESVLLQAYYQSLIDRNFTHCQIAKSISQAEVFFSDEMCCSNFLKPQGIILG